MKVRNGFVSNSSSSSFIIKLIRPTKKFNINEIFKSDTTFGARVHNYNINKKTLLNYIKSGYGQGEYSDNKRSSMNYKYIHVDKKIFKRKVIDYLGFDKIIDIYRDLFEKGRIIPHIDKINYELILEIFIGWYLNTELPKDNKKREETELFKKKILSLHHSYLLLTDIRERLYLMDLDNFFKNENNENDETDEERLKKEEKIKKAKEEEKTYTDIAINSLINYGYLKPDIEVTDEFFIQQILSVIIHGVINKITEPFYNDIKFEKVITFEAQGAGDGFVSAESEFLYRNGTNIQMIMNNDYKILSEYDYFNHIENIIISNIKCDMERAKREKKPYKYRLESDILKNGDFTFDLVKNYICMPTADVE